MLTLRPTLLFLLSHETGMYVVMHVKSPRGLGMGPGHSIRILLVMGHYVLSSSSSFTDSVVCVRDTVYKSHPHLSRYSGENT